MKGRPHLSLATAVVVVLALEGLRGSATLDTAPIWPILQAVFAGLALLVAWRWREGLRLSAILTLGLAFQLAWIAIHLHLGVVGDHDPLDVYTGQGNALLHGDYPRSEYPPGAVALFTVEAWLGGGHARIPNAFIMIPFQLLCVAGVWALRTRWSPWLAAFLAVWPLNAFYWEFRFDLVPTAALVVGLALAWRERWYAAGWVLGVGTIVKWTPGLCALAMLFWLLRTERLHTVGRYLLGFSIPVLLGNLPLLIWDRSELLAAYTTQNGRTVTAESFVYLPLRVLWNARPGYWYFGAADVPAEANRAAVLLQIGAVVVLLILATFARRRSAALALAGLTPAVFFLTNRIFSPQFFVLVLAAIVVAAALVVRKGWGLCIVLASCGVATTANTVLFQSILGAQPVGTAPGWTYVSAAIFLPALAAVIWLAVEASLPTAEVDQVEPQGAIVSAGPMRRL